MPDTNNKPNHQDKQNPCLFARCLYQANSMSEFFRLYSDELMKLSENDTNALLEAGFVRSYASQISNPYFLETSQREYTRLKRLASEVNPELQANVEGRCKSAKSAIDKARKYIDNLDLIQDIHAFRIVVYGPFSEQEQVSFCYKLLDKIVRFYLSKGYILCRATPVTNVLDRSSEAYQKLVIPSSTDCKLISWIASDRYKDYILNPKNNSYQSLHVALRAPNGFQFELQIRTFLMDCISKEGDTDVTHHNYKQKKYPNAITLDPEKVHMPGFFVTKDPETGELITRDTIGLLVARPIISG